MKLKDWSNRLIWATILISVVRYAAAFAASDVGEIKGVWSGVLTFLLAITGIGMGVLDTIGGGLLFNGWSRVLPRTGDKWSPRFKILTICVLVLLLSGLFILVPFSMSRLSHESVLGVLGGRDSLWAWGWALMVNVIPYVLIAGVFTGNKMVEGLEGTETSKKPSNPGGKNAESFQKVSNDWRKVRPTLDPNALRSLANLSPAQMQVWASETGFTYKTISNWRSNARAELGLQEYAQ